MENTETVTISQKDYEYYQKLEGLFKQVRAESLGCMFICGSNKDKKLGMPKTIKVCPAYGSDETAVYEIISIHSPGW